MKTYRLNSHNELAVNSSGGQLLKWKVDDTYIKTSTLDKQSLQTKFMYESYAEVIASRLGTRLGLNIVNYKLCEIIIDNSIRTIGCESKDFKPQGFKECSIGKLMQVGKIPILTYGDLNNYNKLIMSVQKLGLNIQTYLDTLLIFDSIILNEDRHYGNFGLLCNKKDILIEPIFDNGNSLFCHKHTEGLTYDKNLIQYLRCKPFHMNFDIQTSLVKHNQIKITNISKLLEYIHNMLNNLVTQELPKDRAIFIEELLRDRLNYIYSKHQL